MNSGIPYFPLDVHLDDKFDLIEAEFGLTGFAVVVKLFQKIYGGQGYYCEWTNDVALLFSKNLGLGGNVVSEIVSSAIRRGIFDKEIYDKYYVLTSKGIQTRYFEAVNRRKNLKVKKQYLLVQVDQICKNVNILVENVNISEENADLFKQSKAEESKGKNSKAEESKVSPLPTEKLTDIILVYEQNISPVTPIIKSNIESFLNDVDGDVIVYAIYEAVEHNARKWSYIKKIIENHRDKGHKTLADIQANKTSWGHRNNIADDNGEYDDLAELTQRRLEET